MTLPHERIRNSNCNLPCCKNVHCHMILLDGKPVFLAGEQWRGNGAGEEWVMSIIKIDKSDKEIKALESVFV